MSLEEERATDYGRRPSPRIYTAVQRQDFAKLVRAELDRLSPAWTASVEFHTGDEVVVSASHGEVRREIRVKLKGQDHREEARNLAAMFAMWCGSPDPVTITDRLKEFTEIAWRDEGAEARAILLRAYIKSCAVTDRGLELTFHGAFGREHDAVLPINGELPTGEEIFAAYRKAAFV